MGIGVRTVCIVECERCEKTTRWILYSGDGKKIKNRAMRSFMKEGWTFEGEYLCPSCSSTRDEEEGV